MGMNADEELQAIQTQFTTELSALEEKYRKDINVAFFLYLDQIQGASEAQRRQYWQQYHQKKEALATSHMEQIQEIITARTQLLNTLDERVRNAPNEIVSPAWYLRVTRFAEGGSSLERFFDVWDIYSREGLREFFRWFLNNAEVTKRCSPIEVEIGL
jgi:hypothetical protein